MVYAAFEYGRSFTNIVNHGPHTLPHNTIPPPAIVLQLLDCAMHEFVVIAHRRCFAELVAIVIVLMRCADRLQPNLCIQIHLNPPHTIPTYDSTRVLFLHKRSEWPKIQANFVIDPTTPQLSGNNQSAQLANKRRHEVQ